MAPRYPTSSPDGPRANSEDLGDIGEEITEKDATEEELEKLIFGDTAGFRERIETFRPRDEDTGSDEDVEQDEEEGLEAVDDKDLFFLDTGDAMRADGAELAPQPGPATDEDEDDELFRKDPPAWIDSDDDRIVVSLASVPRLRKLRRTEAEDIVNGREYMKRLRRQYELMNPLPGWAKAANRAHKKRRRASGSSVSEGSGPDDVTMDAGDDDDGEALSVRPLARLLQDAGALLASSYDQAAGKKRKFRPEVIDIQRTKDVSGAGPSAITSLTTHPRYPLLLSSGPSANLSLHHLSPSSRPVPNPQLTNMHVRGTPLTTTEFHPSTPRIFLGARRRYFHVWNLETGSVERITRVYGHAHEQRSMEVIKPSPCGRHIALLGSVRKGGGVVNVLDANTLQWTAQARIESRGGIADFCWWSGGDGLTIAGKNGEISEWSCQERRAVARWNDEGALGTTVIAMGGKITGGDASEEHWMGGDRWVALGSSSGVVNVYDRRNWARGSGAGIPTNPKPTRTFENLTTPISHLVFSPDAQLLCMSSRWKRDALRLVHLPSCTVYKNWPTSETPLGRISAVTFGRLAAEDADKVEGELALVVGNEQGKIRLWEVRS